MLAASTAELTVRMGVSLAIMGILSWGAMRVLRGRFRLGSARSGLAVHARHQLSRNTSVAVVRAGERYFLVGVSDTSVTLLGEGDDLVVTADSDGAAVDDSSTRPLADPSGPGARSAIEPGPTDVDDPDPAPNRVMASGRLRSGRSVSGSGRHGRSRNTQLRAGRADGTGTDGARKRQGRDDGPATSGMNVIDVLREKTVRRT